MNFLNKENSGSHPSDEKKKHKRSKASETTKHAKEIVAESANSAAKNEVDVRPVTIDDATQPLPHIELLPTATLVPRPEAEAVVETGIGTMASPRRLQCKQIEVGYATDVGMVRSNNQDNLAAFMGVVPRSEGTQELLFGYFVVADGMGGHEHGEVASSIAVITTLKGIISQFYFPSLEGRAPGNPGDMPGEVLAKIIEEANLAIINAGREFRGNMGTTLTSIVMVGNTVYLGHIGDSRLYGIERDTKQLVQLSKDHSLVARLVEAGILTAEEASFSPDRSKLYRSLGQRLESPADTDYFRTGDFSHFLLCSDGLWDMVTNEAIHQILLSYEDPATASQELIRAANSAGGDDNISVLVVKL